MNQNLLGVSPIIIAGMHRSGTSLTAALLQKVGLDIGQKLVGAAYGNIKGHFENVDFVEFHKEVLKFHQIDQLGYTLKPSLEIPPKYRQKAQTLIQFQSSSLWGWKDPRTTLFLDFWQDLLPDSHYIFVYRSPWEVVDSLYRRATDSILLESPETAVKLWIHYNQKVLEFYHKYPDQCLLIHVNQVGHEPAFFIEKICQKFSVTLNPPPLDNFDQSLLISEILQTHRPSLIEEYFPQALEIYHTLESTAADLSFAANHPNTEAIIHSNPALWVFQDWSEIRQLEKATKILNLELTDWKNLFEEAKERVIQLENELGKVELKLAGATQQSQEAITKLVATETQLGEMELLYQGVDQKAKEAIEKLVNTEKLLGQVELKYNEVLGLFIQAQNQLNYQEWYTQKIRQEAQEKLIETEQRLGTTELERNGLQNLLDQAIQKLSILEKELGKTQHELDANLNQLNASMSKISLLESILGETQAEKEHLNAELLAIHSSKLWKIRQNWLELKSRTHHLKNRLTPRFFNKIDYPYYSEIQGNHLQIVGWCFHPYKQLKGIRVQVGNQIFGGKYGIERPDVQEFFPYLSQAKYSGFLLDFKLDSGFYNLELEVQESSGKWTRFLTYPLIISTIQGAFDAPREWKQKEGEILFAGWCCHPQYKINKLFLCYGNHSIECAYGLRRKDVGAVFPDWNYSADSGFEILTNIPIGSWEIYLKAELETGEILTFYSPQKLEINRIGITEKLADKSQETLRFLRAIKKRAQERKQRLGRYFPMPWEIPTIIRRSREIYQQQKQFSLGGELHPPQGFIIPEPLDSYHAWLGVNQWNHQTLEFLNQRLRNCQGILPKISVITPVYNPPIEFLEKAIESVVQQVYQNWELCLADDYSTDPQVTETLKKWMEKDSRIRVTFRQENGNISAATNTAAELATGEFLVFLDNDDELTPDALAEVALYLATHPQTDFLYSDDDKIDGNGQRFAPQFKPDWSPELLLSYMYLGHICAVRREIFEKIGGKRVGFEGAQDYDFALRATEICRQVDHLPLVLYHWRAIAGSTALSGAAKPASFLAGEKAVQDALNRRKITGKVYQPHWAIEENLGIFRQTFPDEGPSVTLIIPTKNKLTLLRACLESIERTTYKNYQVVVIDNESDDPATLTYLSQISHSVLKIKNKHGKFNYARINNLAVESATTDYILLLNNDTEIINPHWLSQMMGYAQIPGVGAVGARLLYPDERIQHAGIIHGYHHGLAGHAFKLTPRESRGYLSHGFLPRNYSAVTAACLLTPRELFLKMGGFDEQNFAVAYNDVDYCLRLSERGYRSVYCPDAELLHREGVSRGFKDNPQEVASYRRKYANKKDPFYSPHLSLANEFFQIQPRCYKTDLQKIRKIRVLMCSNSLEYTGAPLHQYEIALGLAEQGLIEPIIFCVTDGPLRQTYEENGIQVIVRDHPLEHIYQRHIYDQVLQDFAQEITPLGIDVMYINTLENFFMVDLAHFLKIPSVWNVHESQPWQTYFNRFGSEIATRALECFAFPYRVIFVADATQNLFWQLNSHHNFTVIHNGLDLNRLDHSLTREEARKLLQISADEVMLLVLGTVCERKGQKDLVNALPFLSEKVSKKVRCFIVGDRPSLYSTELHNLVKNLPESLQKQITIVPETPETAPYYQGSDIFVCTSRIESFPRVILEAMAYNLPIITTPVFGIPEQVRPDINGLFYPPNNPQALAQELTHLLEDESLRQTFAHNAKYVLDSLNSFAEMKQAYGEIFQEAFLSSVL